MSFFTKPKDSRNPKPASDESRPLPYLTRCGNIWKSHVPDRGQADALQGELLREVEALRYEAQDNGNINWDEDFSYFCDFLKTTLCDQEALPEDMKTAVRTAADRIKACGEYGRMFADGLIPADKVDIDRIACVDDEPYDAIANAIGCLDASVDGAPIPYTPNPALWR